MNTEITTNSTDFETDSEIEDLYIEDPYIENKFLQSKENQNSHFNQTSKQEVNDITKPNKLKSDAKNQTSESKEELNQFISEHKDLIKEAATQLFTDIINRPEDFEFDKKLEKEIAHDLYPLIQKTVKNNQCTSQYSDPQQKILSDEILKELKEQYMDLLFFQSYQNELNKPNLAINSEQSSLVIKEFDEDKSATTTECSAIFDDENIATVLEDSNDAQGRQLPPEQNNPQPKIEIPNLFLAFLRCIAKLFCCCMPPGSEHSNRCCFFKSEETQSNECASLIQRHT